jgi:diguanylate cyclase (GGDEF)-like protein/putative nucleotidyltransferase with HDIG domain
VVLVLVMFASYRRRLSLATEAELSHLRESLFVDPVTGLRNYRAFHEDLEADFASAARENCLVLADVVGFRALNETSGHAAADTHLEAIGAALGDAVGDSGRCYRVGADEFAIVLPDQNAWVGLSLVEQARRGLGADTGSASSGIRLGVARADREEGKAELVRRANLAHLTARRSQRSAVVYSTDLEAVETGPEREDEGLHALTTALAQAVDAKDSYTRSHCETVSTIAALIAGELGVDPRWVARVRLAGLLHDVGKIGIPDAILNKPGKLDDSEWEVMRSHARLGSDILAAAGLHEEAAWVLHHHERPDGRGYPHGLARDAVPLESRIILTADTFEAITSDRPYRRGRSADEALGEIRRHIGTQFDPACVAALERVLGRRDAEMPRELTLAASLS